VFAQAFRFCKLAEQFPSLFAVDHRHHHNRNLAA
jgi:hypothetical protein